MYLLTDNCVSQYKCLHTFALTRNLAIENNLNIVRIYGPPGHGKGEVDSAGGGVKSFLRMTTYQTGNFFNNAEEALAMLEPLKGTAVERIYRLESEIYRPEDHTGITVNGSNDLYFWHFYPTGQYNIINLRHRAL